MSTVPGGGDPAGFEDDPNAVRFTDKRRIDPETGEIREPEDDSATAETSSDPIAHLDFEPELSPDLTAATEKVANLTDQLARLQADFVNFRRRVDRDRHVSRELAIAEVIEALIPVFDDIDSAREHDELTGPFAAIVEKLEATLARFGWERYGAAGEPFDPTMHDAFTHAHSDEVDGPTIGQVYQNGHRVGDRILRATRVGVLDAND